MLPFEIDLRPGESPYRQVVYAATRAIVTGELAPGMAFPSVRELSHALKINPNTAQKAIAELTREGLLEVHPGVGTVVAVPPRPAAAERRAMLARDIEPLVIRAKRLGLDADDLQRAIATQWEQLFGADAGAVRRG